MADRAVEAIRRAILSGELDAGSQLRETRLSQDLAISRGPLREALQRLEEEGLVVRRAFRGSFVAEVSTEVLREIEQLRRLLEPYAVIEGIDRLREGPAHDEIVAAVEALQRTAEAGDAGGAVDAHLAIHRAIYKAAGNSVLLAAWRSWENQLRLFLAVEHRQHSNLAELAKGHRRMLRVIEAGDEDEIRRHFAEHIPLTDASMTGPTISDAPP